MSKRFSSVLLLSPLVCLPMFAVEAGAKPAPAGHPIAAPVHKPPHIVRPLHDGKRTWRFDKFGHRDRDHRGRHDDRFFDSGFPLGFWDWPYYGAYSGAAPDDDYVSSTGIPYPGWWGERRFYRTGCASEEVAVSSAHGPTTVTVTRCSVPVAPAPPLK